MDSDGFVRATVEKVRTMKWELNVYMYTHPNK